MPWPRAARTSTRNWPAWRAPRAADAGPETGLSVRECDVVRLIARGHSNKDIAAHLKVSVKTVETYKSRAMEKLHIRSRVDIVRFAAKSGWLDDVKEPLVATSDGGPPS